MHNVVLQEQMDDLRETTGVSFKDAYITADIKKDFKQADFRGATLQDIKIRDAVFTECDFSEATIRADITNAKFIRCNFKGATFQHAYIYESAFIENDFQESQFLQSSIHRTELSKNSFAITKMAGVNMSNTVVREANINTDTIRYDFPGATREELEKMKNICIEELKGMAQLNPYKVESITINFSSAELLMIQECIKEYPHNRYPWKANLMDSIQEKVSQVYQKPVMTAGEFQMHIHEQIKYEKEHRFTNDEDEEFLKLSVELTAQKIRFYNDVQETGNSYSEAVEEALANAEPLAPEFELEL